MKLAIFDIDGTLTNTNSVDDDCFIQALSDAHGITGINTDWSAYPHTTDSGITLQVFQEKFGRDPEESELEKLKSCFASLLSEQYEADSSGFAAIAGAAAALSRLSQEPDWAVAIATGSWRESALLKIRAAKLDTDGIPAAFAEDGPSRESILQSAISQSLKPPGVDSFTRTVSLGDGLWDLRTARVLDFAFVGVGRGDAAARLRTAGASHVIENFVDYDGLINCLNEAAVPG